MPQVLTDICWDVVEGDRAAACVTSALGVSESTAVEGHVFTTAEHFIEEYSNDAWRVEFMDHEEGSVVRWVLDTEKRYTVVDGPNQVTATMSAEAMGVAITLFALYVVAAKYQSERAYEAYLRLIDVSRILPDWHFIARMID